jgi:hypothetical protein
VDPYDDVQNTIADRKVETGFFGGLREPVRGRKWDHARDDDPVIMKSGINPNASPWRNFIKASAYGSSETEDSKLVDQEFLDNLTPGYDRPWRGDLESNGDQDPVSALLYSKKRRRTLIRRVQVSGYSCSIFGTWPRANLFTAYSSHESLCAPYFPTYCACNICHRFRHSGFCSPSL